MPADDPNDEYELEVIDDAEWHVDEDGTEYFVEGGVRYELGEDGYAYAVDPSEGSRDPADAAPDAAAPEPATTAPAPATDAPAPSPDGGRRPISSQGRFSAPVAPGSDAPSWPSADEGPAGDPEVPAEDGPPPFSREAAGTRAGGPSSADPERTTEIRVDDVASGNGRTELLRLEAVRSGYGNLPVLHGVEMAIRAGETAVLLGLNGAGKTTTAMNICGALKTWNGTIIFDGQDITSWSTKKAVDAGVVMVPEGRRVFPDLSVAKNLQMGAWSQRKDKDWLDAQRERVFDYFPRLRERSEQLAGTLSGGEQQMLAIGRGLMARPKLLIIDEASMGLAPVIVSDVFAIVGQINEDGTTVLMIEQNVAALDVADVAYVMEQGRMVRELRGEALRDRSQVSDVLMG